MENTYTHVSRIPSHYVGKDCMQIMLGISFLNLDIGSNLLVMNERKLEL